ncbi:MAG: BsuPI-related putative proteinase inhibitor [Chthoniobacteraceae bacterium]
MRLSPLTSQLSTYLSLCCALLLGGCSSAPKSDEPGLLGRMWSSTQRLNPLSRDLKPREMKSAPPPNLKSLVASVSVEPPAPKLSEVRQVKVTVQLINRGKRTVRLDFPSTQRIEVVIKDKTGRIIDRWSEDRRFEHGQGIVTINPGERLEYSASVATREMKPEEAFTIEAWLPAHDSLRASATVTPVK